MSYRNFSAICLLIYPLLVCATLAEAQKKTATGNSKKTNQAQTVHRKTNTKRKKTALQTISGGIMNGKAVNLITPDYPQSAKAVGVYGTVSVLVLVETDGKIIEASGTNGHPLLRPVSIKAALQSEFEPVTLGGNPVRVRGVIIYNFVLHQWNWLEVGYTLGYGSSNYYSIKTLPETLPFGYEEERQLLNQWFAANENQDKIIETVVASIRNKLNNEAKEFWFFEVGLALARYRQEPKNNERTSNENSPNIQNLKQLIQNAPVEPDDKLLEQMKELIVLIDKSDTSKIYLALRKLEESFPYVGK